MKILPFIFAAAVIAAVRFWGLAAGFLTVTIGGPIAVALYFWMESRHRLKEAGQRINHLFIIAIPPEEEDLVLPGMEDFYRTARHGQVHQLVDKEKHLLKKAGNRTGASVFPIYWRDGVNVTEDLEQYKERCCEIIKGEQRTHHDHLKKASNGWYVKYHHGEKTTFETEPE